MDPELQRRMDHEYRREMEAWERQADAISGSLGDALRGLVGSEVVVHCFGLPAMRGEMVLQAGDLVCLTDDVQWHIRRDAVQRAERIGDGSGQLPWVSAGSFSDAVHAVRMAEVKATVFSLEGESVTGLVSAAGPDHLILERRTIIPYSSITAMSTAAR